MQPTGLRRPSSFALPPSQSLTGTFLRDIHFQMAQDAVPAANAIVCDQALLLSPLIQE
jgi:hypothetical protein